MHYSVNQLFGVLENLTFINKYSFLKSILVMAVGGAAGRSLKFASCQDG